MNEIKEAIENGKWDSMTGVQKIVLCGSHTGIQVAEVIDELLDKIRKLAEE